MIVKKIFIEAPGKIILSGEHSAVYGHPAIVTAIDRTLSLSLKYKDEFNSSFFIDLLDKFGKYGTDDVINGIREYIGKSDKLEIDSRLPIGSGMGSSAAIAAALSTLVLELSGKKYSRADINRYAFELEKIAHGKPSGIDNTAVVYGGIKKFYRNRRNEMVGVEIRGRNFLDRLFIVATGRPVETTAKMVAKVRKRFNKNPEEVGLTMNSIGKTTEMIQDLINNGGNEEDFMKSISINQRLLESIGIVGERCQEFVRLIEALGGAAKVSGAGGFIAESGIVIIYLPKNININSLLIAKGYQMFPIKISGGIRMIK